MSPVEATVELVNLIAARAAKTAVVDQMLRTVLVVPVLVPDSDHPDRLAPFTVSKGDVTDAVAFATVEDAEQVRDLIPYVISMAGVSLVLRLPDGVGLLLFSEHGNVAFEPSLLADIRSDMRALAEGTSEP